jgi:hypothetical protein
MNPVKKGIYSLPAAARALAAANRRYLKFSSAIETPTAGIDARRKTSETLREAGHTRPEFNLFSFGENSAPASVPTSRMQTLSTKHQRTGLRHPKHLRIHGRINKGSATPITTI